MILQEFPVLEELVLKELVKLPGATAKRVWESLRASRAGLHLARGV